MPDFMSTSVALMRVLFRWPYCCDLVGVASPSLTRRHYLPAGFPVLQALTVAPPPLPLWLRCRGCVMKVSAGAGHPTINSSLHFDQLWLSIMIHLLIMFTELLMTNFAFVVLIIISLLQAPCHLGCCQPLLA